MKILDEQTRIKVIVHFLKQRDYSSHSINETEATVVEKNWLVGVINTTQKRSLITSPRQLIAGRLLGAGFEHMDSPQPKSKARLGFPD